MGQVQEQFLCDFSEKVTVLQMHFYTVAVAKEDAIWISILGKVNFIHVSKDCT
jgi:hypothetical protein